MLERPSRPPERKGGAGPRRGENRAPGDAGIRVLPVTWISPSWSQAPPRTRGRCRILVLDPAQGHQDSIGERHRVGQGRQAVGDPARVGHKQVHSGRATRPRREGDDHRAIARIDPKADLACPGASAPLDAGRAAGERQNLGRGHVHDGTKRTRARFVKSSVEASSPPALRVLASGSAAFARAIRPDDVQAARRTARWLPGRGPRRRPDVRYPDRPRPADATKPGLFPPPAADRRRRAATSRFPARPRASGSRSPGLADADSRNRGNGTCGRREAGRKRR